jgi:hypothetical protein
MKAYSMDLRERLVAAGGGGMRKAAAARVYAVGLSTVKRYARQQATAGASAGQIAAGAGARDPGGRRGGAAGAGGGARGRDAGRPPAAPGGRAGRGGQPGDDEPRLRAGRPAAQKKSLRATERDAAARATWREAVAARDPATLVFVDESGTPLAMTPRRARAPRGQRAYGAVPRNRGGNTTLIAALTPPGSARR